MTTGRNVAHMLTQHSYSQILLGPKDGAELQCGNCDHYRVESLVKHRTNDIVDPRKGIVQVNRDDIQFELVTQSEGIWSPFKGLLLKNDQDSETNLKNRPLNIGIVDVSTLILLPAALLTCYTTETLLTATANDSNLQEWHSWQFHSTDRGHHIRNGASLSSQVKFHPFLRGRLFTKPRLPPA